MRHSRLKVCFKGGGIWEGVCLLFFYHPAPAWGVFDIGHRSRGLRRAITRYIVGRGVGVSGGQVFEHCQKVDGVQRFARLEGA